MRTLFESFESVDAFDLNELIEETRSSGEIAEGTTGVDPPTQASDYRQWWHARFDAVVGGGRRQEGGEGKEGAEMKGRADSSLIDLPGWEYVGKKEGEEGEEGKNGVLGADGKEGGEEENE